MEITVSAVLRASAEPREIGYAIFQYIADTFERIDDAGCDWYTDDQGNVLIAGNRSWRPFPQNTELTALVDAANILIIGHALRMPDPGYLTWDALVASGELSGYTRTNGQTLGAAVAAEAPCAQCGGDCEFIAMEQESDGFHSYRAFARCSVCDAVVEF